MSDERRHASKPSHGHAAAGTPLLDGAATAHNDAAARSAAALVAPATSTVWIVPAWAQWIAYVAVLATMIGLYLREQRQPGAPLHTYLEAVRRVRQPRRRRRRVITAVAVAIFLIYAVVVLAHSVAERRTP